MAYAPGIKARSLRRIGGTDQTIHGSGRLAEGVHEVVVANAEVEDGKISVTLENEYGDTHKEFWWLVTTFEDKKYTSEWRNWLASVIPDLEAIKLYKKTLDVEGFIGCRMLITVGKDREGYYLVRDGDKWAAMWWPTLEQITDWDHVTKVLDQVGHLNKSYSKIVDINASKWLTTNIKRYCEHVLHIIEERKLAT